MLLVREDQILPYLPFLWLHTSQLPHEHVVLQRMRCTAGNFHHSLPAADDPPIHGHFLRLPEVLLLPEEDAESATV